MLHSDSRPPSSMPLTMARAVSWRSVEAIGAAVAVVVTRVRLYTSDGFMADSELTPVPPRVADGARSPVPTREAWRDAWLRAYVDPSGFWLEQAGRLHWRRPPTRGLEGSFHTIGERPLAWFADGQLNVNDSCVDRHLRDRA